VQSVGAEPSIIDDRCYYLSFRQIHHSDRNKHVRAVPSIIDDRCFSLPRHACSWASSGPPLHGAKPLASVYVISIFTLRKLFEFLSVKHTHIRLEISTLPHGPIFDCGWCVVLLKRHSSMGGIYSEFAMQTLEQRHRAKTTATQAYKYFVTLTRHVGRECIPRVGGCAGAPQGVHRLLRALSHGTGRCVADGGAHVPEVFAVCAMCSWTCKFTTARKSWHKHNCPLIDSSGQEPAKRGRAKREGRIARRAPYRCEDKFSACLFARAAAGVKWGSVLPLPTCGLMMKWSSSLSLVHPWSSQNASMSRPLRTAILGSPTTGETAGLESGLSRSSSWSAGAARRGGQSSGGCAGRLQRG